MVQAADIEERLTLYTSVCVISESLHVGTHHAAKRPQKQKLGNTKWGCCTTEAIGGALHRSCLLEPHFIEAALEEIGESAKLEIGSAHLNTGEFRDDMRRSFLLVTMTKCGQRPKLNERVRAHGH